MPDARLDVRYAADSNHLRSAAKRRDAPRTDFRGGGPILPDPFGVGSLLFLMEDHSGAMTVTLTNRSRIT